FSLFTLFIVIISLSFTIFFILHERKTYQEQLVNEGELLASLLAYNARLAVFAENREMLQTAAEGIAKNSNVTSVAIFATNGELLAKVEKNGNVTATFAQRAEEKK